MRRVLLVYTGDGFVRLCAPGRESAPRAVVPDGGVLGAGDGFVDVRPASREEHLVLELTYRRCEYAGPDLADVATESAEVVYGADRLRCADARGPVDGVELPLVAGAGPHGVRVDVVGHRAARERPPVPGTSAERILVEVWPRDGLTGAQWTALLGEVPIWG
ncbi:hypothetical protein CLV72_1011241 [Allonocardiopsis opalescens]|uniref:Uncharacterized protein n=1 Tax=Allonocardiopsis opalescens TaxID=1144618 RepID=A0A2T0QFE2_9ACTN|nr:hypothetical protein CLV72_1011241 [Allonocardiopsis opalescens]